MNNDFALVFDLDGTLIDSAKGIYDSYKFAIEKLNCKRITGINFKDFKKLIGPPFDQMQLHLHPEFNENQRKELISNFRKHYDKKGFLNYQVFSSIKKLLKNLNQQGYKLYILSNKKFPSIEIIKEKEFKNIFSKCWGRSPKYNKEDILLKLKEIYLDKIIYIGDTLSDLNASNKSNVYFIYCKYGYGDIQDYRNYSYCENTKQLENIIINVIQNLKFE